MNDGSIFKDEEHSPKRLAECERITTGLQKEVDCVSTDLKAHVKESGPVREDVACIKVALFGYDYEKKGGLCGQIFEIKNHITKTYDRLFHIFLLLAGTLITIGGFWRTTEMRLNALEKIENSVSIDKSLKN